MRSNKLSHYSHKLPENCSLEDIQYHLYVLDKVRRGLDDARQHGTLSQEDVEKRLSKWLTGQCGQPVLWPTEKPSPLTSPPILLPTQAQ
jgi:hypothetical protein